MELREIFDFGKLGVITEKAKLPKYALAKLNYNFARADMENDNFRTYNESILSREIGRKSEELRTQKIPGMLNHPISGITELDKIAHVLTGVSYDRKTKLASAESYILDTSKGRDFMVMLDSEIKMGCSMRGWGNVKNGYVQSDWKFGTVDFVLRPSFSDAMITKSNIIESANNIFDEKGNNKGENMKNMLGLSEEYVDEMMQFSYDIYRKEENFKGSFAEWEKQMGNAYLAEILVQEGKCANTEEALKHLGVKKDFKKQISALDEKTYSSAVDEGYKGTWQEWEEMLGHLGVKEEIEKISSAPIQEKVTPGEIYLEARSAGVDPKIYAEKINKNVELQEKGEEERRAVREAQSPGRTRFVQKEDIYPDGEKRIVWVKEEEDYQEKLGRIREGIKDQQRKVLTEDERAEIVARETGSTAERVKEIWAFERKKKEKEQKELAHYRLINMERAMAGFGGETRPDSLKRSRRILEREEK